MARKITGLVVYIVAWVEAYLHTKWHLDPSSCSATTDMGRKLGEAAELLVLGRGHGFQSNTTWPGQRPISVPSGILIHQAIWPQQTWAKNWEGAVPFSGGAGSPSNTMWPGPRPITTPSFILIHPTVWPQYTNVRDRTNRQTDRERSDSTGRTGLQTVAQKWFT